jgi:CRP/FNR family transcriptional regulator
MAMSFNEEVRLLSAADILEPLSEEEVEDLARRYPDTRLGRGEVLFAPDERLFILKEGRIRVYQTNPKGQEITLVVVEEGALFGEMALTAQRMRGGYAQALEPSVALSLRREDLEDLILSKPEVGLRLIERLSERVRELEVRLKDVSLKEVPARLASLILRLLESEGIRSGEGHKVIPTRYTHEQVGAMIGANRVAVTRAFGELREEGAVEQRGRRIYVLDEEALKRAAEGERGGAGQDSE